MAEETLSSHGKASKGTGSGGIRSGSKNPLARSAPSPPSTPATFADFFVYAHNLQGHLGQDPVEFYIRAKYRIAQARRGVFPEISARLQRQRQVLLGRIERLRLRHETLAGLFRGEAPAEELRRAMERLGLSGPRAGEDLLAAARRHRDQAWDRLGRLGPRLQALESRMAAEGALVGRALEELEGLVIDLERSGVFQVQFAGLPTVNKSAEAFRRLVERRIEAILETGSLKEQEAALDELIQAARGALGRREARRLSELKELGRAKELLSEVDRKEKASSARLLRLSAPSQEAFERAWLKAAAALHREEFQIEPALEHRAEEREEAFLAHRAKETERRLARRYEKIKQALIDRRLPGRKASQIARRNVARRADRLEEMLLAFSQAKDPRALQGHPDLDSLVGRFIFRRSDQGAWQPLEVLRVEKEGLPEPQLIVRPYALRAGEEAQILYRTTPDRLLQGYQANFFDDVLERTEQLARLDVKLRPGGTSAASPVHAVWDDLERKRRELDRRLAEKNQDIVRRKFAESYLRHRELDVRLRSTKEVIEELLGFNYAVSGSRLGLGEGLRIPYKYFEVMRKHFPFFLYGRGASEILGQVVQEATLLLYEDPSLVRLVTELPKPFKTHWEWYRSEPFQERLERLVAGALHQARGRVFSAELSHVSGRDSALITSLEYLKRAFEQGSLGEKATHTGRQLQSLQRIVSDVKSGRIPVPRILEPLVEASEREIYGAWRLVAAGAGDRPLSLSLALERALRAEERVSELETFANVRSSADLLAEMKEAQRELGRAVEELEAYADLDPDLYSARIRRDVAERAEVATPARRPRPPIWRPPRMSRRYDDEWNRLMRAYAKQVRKRSDAVPDPGRLLSKKNVQAYFLAVAERILGRPLSEEEIGLLLQRGLDELYAMARRETGPVETKASVRAVSDIVESGMGRPDDFFILQEGKRIAARYAGTPELNQAGARFVIPSTGAVVDLYQGTAGSALEEFPISASQLKYYDVASVHPLFGGDRPWTGGRHATLRPPVHPRLIADMGYSVADVLAGARFLRGGRAVGAIDIETTGLLEDYQKFGLQSRFLPTEIGLAKYRIEGSSLELLSEQQLLIRPLKRQADWIRRLAAMSEEEFVRRYAKADPSLEAAARSVYQQTLRGYASLAAGPAVRDMGRQMAEEELRRLALEGLEKATREGVYLSQALRKLSGFMDELATETGERHLIAANAARAEAKWLSAFAEAKGKSLRSALAGVVWHDPQPLFRLLHPEEQLYNLSHIAQKLGIDVDPGQVHTALYDAKLAARAMIQLAADQRLETLLRAVEPQNLLHEGQILLRVHRGERTLWEVARILHGGPDRQPTVRLRKILGEPAELHRSGASMGEIEQKLYGQFIPVASSGSGDVEVLLQTAAQGYDELPHALRPGERSVALRVSAEEAERLRQIEAGYWADRARREIRKAFSSPQSPVFDLVLQRPGSEAFQQALEAIRPRWASEAGAEAFRSTVEQFARSAEGRLHRRFFTQVYSLLEEGIVDHRGAASLLAAYYNNIREIRRPQRRLSLEASRLRIDTKIPGVGAKSLPLASVEATHSALEDVAWSIARAKATHEPPSAYYGLALSELRRSVQSLLPAEIAETASLHEMAQALHAHGRRLWEEGKLLAEDLAAGFLPEEKAERRRVIQEIVRLQDDLLKERRPLLERARSLASRPAIGDFAASEVFAFLEGRPSGIPLPESPEGLEALRRTLWRDVTRAALDERHEAFAQARAFLGLDAGDPGQIRLPFPVRGEYGVRLGEVTLEEWPEVKRQLRRGQGLEPGMRRRIMEFWAQRFSERLERRRGIDGLAALASQGRLQGPGARGPVWAGLAGAAALGLYAVGRINLQNLKTPQTASVPPQVPQGLEIEVQATRSRPVDIQATVNAATAAIQTSLGIPLNVNVHQVDDTRSIDRRWAQEVVATALRG